MTMHAFTFQGHAYHAALVGHQDFRGMLTPESKERAHVAATATAVHMGADQGLALVRPVTNEILATAWEAVQLGERENLRFNGSYIDFRRDPDKPTQVWVEQGGCWARDCDWMWLHVWERAS